MKKWMVCALIFGLIAVSHAGGANAQATCDDLGDALNEAAFEQLTQVRITHGSASSFVGAEEVFSSEGNKTVRLMRGRALSGAFTMTGSELCVKGAGDVQQCGSVRACGSRQGHYAFIDPEGNHLGRIVASSLHPPLISELSGFHQEPAFCALQGVAVEELSERFLAGRRLILDLDNNYQRAAIDFETGNRIVRTTLFGPRESSGGIYKITDGKVCIIHSGTQTRVCGAITTCLTGEVAHVFISENGVQLGAEPMPWFSQFLGPQTIAVLKAIQPEGMPSETRDISTRRSKPVFCGRPSKTSEELSGLVLRNMRFAFGPASRFDGTVTELTGSFARYASSALATRAGDLSEGASSSWEYSIIGNKLCFRENDGGVLECGELKTCDSGEVRRVLMSISGDQLAGEPNDDTGPLWEFRSDDILGRSPVGDSTPATPSIDILYPYPEPAFCAIPADTPIDAPRIDIVGMGFAFGPDSQFENTVLRLLDDKEAIKVEDGNISDRNWKYTVSSSGVLCYSDFNGGLRECGEIRDCKSGEVHHVLMSSDGRQLAGEIDGRDGSLRSIRPREVLDRKPASVLFARSGASTTQDRGTVSVFCAKPKEWPRNLSRVDLAGMGFVFGPESHFGGTTIRLHSDNEAIRAVHGKISDRKWKYQVSDGRLCYGDSSGIQRECAEIRVCESGEVGHVLVSSDGLQLGGEIDDRYAHIEDIRLGDFLVQVSERMESATTLTLGEGGNRELMKRQVAITAPSAPFCTTLGEAVAIPSSGELFPARFIHGAQSPLAGVVDTMLGEGRSLRRWPGVQLEKEVRVTNEVDEEICLPGDQAGTPPICGKWRRCVSGEVESVLVNEADGIQLAAQPNPGTFEYAAAIEPETLDPGACGELGGAPRDYVTESLDGAVMEPPRGVGPLPITERIEDLAAGRATRLYDGVEIATRIRRDGRNICVERIRGTGYECGVLRACKGVGAQFALVGAGERIIRHVQIPGYHKNLPGVPMEEWVRGRGGRFNYPVDRTGRADAARSLPRNLELFGKCKGFEVIGDTEREDLLGFMWIGECPGARADGRGHVLAVLQDQVVSFEFGPRKGLEMNSGRIQWSLPPFDWKASIHCNKENGEAPEISVNLVVPTQINLDSPWLFIPALQDMETTFAEICSADRSDATAKVRISGHRENSASVTYYRQSNGSWGGRMTGEEGRFFEQRYRADRKWIDRIQNEVAVHYESNARRAYLAGVGEIYSERRNVGNPADVLALDLTQGILALRRGLNFSLSWQDPVFREAHFEIRNRMRQTDWFRAMERGFPPSSVWRASFSRRRADPGEASFEVICRVEPSDVIDVSEGDYLRVKGYLVSYVDGKAILDCDVR